MKKILVADDEEQIREILFNYLTNAGYEVVTAIDGMKAWEAFQNDTFNLVLLDIMMPKIDGFGVCELIRKVSDVPVIFLSALDSEEKLLAGYDSQADDYVTKPFSMPILLRKIGAILRRNSDISSDNTTTYKNISINKDSMEVKVSGSQIMLTVKEYEILCLLISNPGRVFTRENIIETVWKTNDGVEDRVVDSHIKNLRQKIGEDYVETIRGIGYRVAKESN